jgi:nucleotide-binding universal stress UspA family protein
MTIRTIVVGLDGSEGSDRALRWAISRAADLRAEVVAVYGFRPVVPELSAGIPAFDPHAMVESLRATLEDDWSAPLDAAGIPYRAELVEADPVTAILGAADRHGADMIVLGAQGHGGFVDRLLGGVTYKVAHRARQPVVIVPSGEA